MAKKATTTTTIANCLAQMTLAQLSAKLVSGQLPAAEYEAELQRRLEAAHQNGQMVGRSQGGAARAFSATAGTYQGVKVIRFEGNFKPWSKSAATIAHVMRNTDAVREALAKSGIDC